MKIKPILIYLTIFVATLALGAGALYMSHEAGKKSVTLEDVLHDEGLSQPDIETGTDIYLAVLRREPVSEETLQWMPTPPRNDRYTVIRPDYPNPELFYLQGLDKSKSARLYRIPVLYNGEHADLKPGNEVYYDSALKAWLMDCPSTPENTSIRQDPETGDITITWE